MKRFAPIKVFHFSLGFGWWWGNKVFFKIGAVVPFWFVINTLEYANNWKDVGQGSSYSWSKERQEQKGG